MRPSRAERGHGIRERQQSEELAHVRPTHDREKTVSAAAHPFERQRHAVVGVDVMERGRRRAGRPRSVELSQ